METGKLIVVEGSCDGIGKSTQYKLLGEHLTKDGVNIHTHHFPSYNTYQGKPVEEYLRGEYGHPSELSPYFVNSLYALDRAISWQLELKEKFEEGCTILLDRYTTSSIFYQSALIESLEKKKEFIDYVCDFEYEKLGIKTPDHVIFLHAPFDLVTKMRNARENNAGVVNDIHESDLEYMRKVYDNAMFVADYLGWDMVDCTKNSKMASIEDIHEKVYQLVKK